MGQGRLAILRLSQVFACSPLAVVVASPMRTIPCRFFVGFFIVSMVVVVALGSGLAALPQSRRVSGQIALTGLQRSHAERLPILSGASCFTP